MFIHKGGPVTGSRLIANQIVDASSADQVLTLPAITAANHGYLYQGGKVGQYKLTAQTTGNDKITGSGPGYGIETLNPAAAFMKVIADNDTKTWHLMGHVGRWAIEGIKVYVPMEEITSYVPSTTVGVAPETAFNQYGYTNPGVIMAPGAIWSGLPSGIFPNVYDFDGSAGYVDFLSGANLDMFGSLSDDWTLSIMASFDNALTAVAETIVQQYEDASNRWYIDRRADEKLEIAMFSGGATKLVLVSTNTIADINQHQIDLAKVDDEFAIYIDGVHNGNATLSDVDTYTGPLYFGQRGNSTQWFDGQMAGCILAQQNIYGVDPTSGASTTVERRLPGGYIHE